MFIAAGNPTHSGMYVAYVNNDVVDMPVSDRILLMWDDNVKQWFYRMSSQRYRGHVYGWIGPLPIMQLTDGEDKNARKSR